MRDEKNRLCVLFIKKETEQHKNQNNKCFKEKKKETEQLSKDLERPLKNKNGNSVTDDADILLTP